MADFDSSGITRFAVILDESQARVLPRARGRIVHWTTLLRVAVKEHASGRPGPNMITGDYNRSITQQIDTLQPGEYEGRVGTNNVQSRRLEYGFYGLTDSLGRTFYQPPYPHFRPAFDRVAPMFAADIRSMFGGGLP